MLLPRRHYDANRDCAARDPVAVLAIGQHADGEAVNALPASPREGGDPTPGPRCSRQARELGPGRAGWRPSEGGALCQTRSKAMATEPPPPRQSVASP